MGDIIGRITTSLASFNKIDVAVVIIIAMFAIVDFKKGFIKAAFGFLPSVLAFIAAYFISPSVCALIKGTSMFYQMKEKIMGFLDIKNIGSSESLIFQNEIIENMKLPEIFKNSILEKSLENQNLINTKGITNYIAGYIASAILGVLVFIVVFFIIKLLFTQTLYLLDFILKLPILNIFNSAGGLAIGIVKGVFFIWFFFLIATLFFHKPFFEYIIEEAQNSAFSVYLYQNNFLLYLLLKILL
ncbi:MAG: CvpA family protein [Lachnospiraceae bacterium]|nr:CvpA family protein [Lachnospiraceae bacterium]